MTQKGGGNDGEATWANNQTVSKRVLVGGRRLRWGMGYMAPDTGGSNCPQRDQKERESVVACLSRASSKASHPHGGSSSLTGVIASP